jgi:uncharacterized damage-inducible protein DinB
MKMSDAMVAEYLQESQGSRKMLERFPEDKASWKPHEKSMSLGRLALHVAEIPEWAKTIVEDETFDIDAPGYKPKEIETRQELLDYFDKNVELFQKVLGGQPDEHLLQHWKLVYQGHTAVDLPRVVCLRSFVISHMIHHRGQLSVYYRENGVPLPPLYGPTADESM